MTAAALVGTGPLVRLALRRDRIRIPIWLFMLLALLAGQIAGIDQAYPEASDRLAYATVMSSSVAARVFGSPDGTSLGAITMVEIYATLGVLAAIMSSMSVVRHTRQNEETGRLELVASTVVGRHANLAAALIVTVGTMTVYAVAATTLLIALDLPGTGAALMALAIAGTGTVFAGVAAVTSQIAGSARVANGIAGAAIGAIFLLRGGGIVLGSLREDKLGVIIAWPAWLSPLAWGDLAYPFTLHRWWALMLYPATFTTLAAVAVVLAARRDLGRGMIPARACRATAHRSLLSPLGLAVRQQRGTWVWWAASSLVLGITTGVFANEFESLISANDAANQLFSAVGGSAALRDNYFALMFSTLGIVFVTFMVQSVLRLHAEEERALESLLATAVSRTRWMASHITVAVVGVSLLLLLAGLSAGISASLVADTWDLLPKLIVSALVQAPAVLLVGSLCVFGYGATARAAAPVGWGALALCLFTLIGDMFRVPDSVLRISPFAHVPLMPAEKFTATPLLTMLSVGTALVVVGAVLLRRRDIGGA